MIITQEAKKVWNSEESLVYVVVDEHTFGMAIPYTNEVSIVKSSPLRGAGNEEYMGLNLDATGKHVRLATVKDWDTFNVLLDEYTLRDIQSGVFIIDRVHG